MISFQIIGNLVLMVFVILGQLTVVSKCFNDHLKVRTFKQRSPNLKVKGEFFQTSWCIGKS